MAKMTAEEKRQQEKIQYLHSLLKKKNIAVVTLDARWHQLFSDKEKTPQFKKLEKELNELLKKQGKINNDIKDIKKLREKLMKDVLDTADSSNLTEEKRQKRQDVNQKLIVEAREKIEALEEEQFDIPKQIREANTALIIEGVDMCYARIKKNRAEIKELGEWIDETREKLKTRVVMKQDKEEQNARTYTYLHDIFGPDVMEVFDEDSD